jgi:hypothetical protein
MNYTPVNTTYFVYSYNSGLKGNCLLSTWNIALALATYADTVEQNKSDSVMMFKQDPATGNKSEKFAEYRRK